MKRRIVHNFVITFVTVFLLLGFGALNNCQPTSGTVFAKEQAVKGIKLHITGKHTRKFTVVTNSAGKATVSGRIQGDKRVFFKQYKGGYKKFSVRANKKGHFKKVIKLQKAVNKVAYAIDSNKVNKLIKKHPRKYVSKTIVHLTIKRSSASQASQKAASQASSSAKAASIASSKASSEAAESSSRAAAISSSQAAARAAASSSAAAAQAAAQRSASQAASQRNAQANQAAANNTGEQEYVDANGNGLIKGSVDHIYHVPGSTYYNRTKNVVQWFKTVSDAVKAGYRAPLR
ncbi:hypothetical protein [Oenococcus oeni]|uniref:Uncharacterized protein n=2 Tax=Oenococcus oeni TaxID=1247 RepID=A0A6H3GS01_OENOE|nr:hypothetical protein [Oenococcus oeni]EAV38733.1 hypothetical protein OENOO_66044 [Oenococcus oeni ATCC BAA-1163]EJO02222.1 hypothetical protein AWRIB418_660 [Oenococcus oeni AWRIB418]KDE87641.1 hypothetical protein EL27_07885 [Oenococcus oeni]KEP88097.1 hypothetical protein X279_03150 [Oenococcus oeni IOEB_0501]KGH56377.1 hypothetical protein X463_02750 [Oenococcus oeni S22]